MEKMSCHVAMGTCVSLTSTSACLDTALIHARSATESRTAQTVMTKTIALGTLNHVRNVNFSAEMVHVCLIIFVAMDVQNVGILQMKKIVIAKKMSLNVVMGSASIYKRSATDVSTVTIFRMKPTVNAKTVNFAVEMANALKAKDDVMALLTAETTQMKPVVPARTTSFAVEMEAALMSAGNVMELLTAGTMPTKGTVAARPMNSGVVTEPASINLDNVTARLIVGTILMSTTVPFQVALPLSSGVVMGDALTLAESAMTEWTAQTSLMKLIVCLMFAELMSSSANLVNA